MAAPVIRHLPDIGITMISRWVFNCYVVHDGGDGRPFVVDLGLPSQVPLVADALRSTGAELADLGAAVATHGHLDHVGGLPGLCEAHGTDVLLPRTIEDMLAGRMALRSPGPRQVAQILPVLADQPTDLAALRELQPLQGEIGYDGRAIRFDLVPAAWLGDDDHLPGRPDWRVLHAPGHTDDSTCLYHEPSRTLLSGDSVLTLDGRAWFNPEYVDARRSAATETRLRNLPVEHLLPGHGRAVTGPDVMDRAWSFADRPPGTSKLRALAHVLTNHAGRHQH
ncbi:MAG: MBL fold metallo-hydrolase [Acidimicrobiales bacterium]